MTTTNYMPEKIEDGTPSQEYQDIKLPDYIEKVYETDKAAFFEHVVNMFSVNWSSAEDTISPGFWFINPEDEDDFKNYWITTLKDPDAIRQVTEVYEKHGGPIILAQGGAYTPVEVPEDVIKRARASIAQSLERRRRG